MYSSRIHKIRQARLANVPQPLEQWTVEDSNLPWVKSVGAPDSVSNGLLLRVPLGLITVKAGSNEFIDSFLKRLDGFISLHAGISLPNPICFTPNAKLFFKAVQNLLVDVFLIWRQSLFELIGVGSTGNSNVVVLVRWIWPRENPRKLEFLKELVDLLRIWVVSIRVKKKIYHKRLSVVALSKRPKELLYRFVVTFETRSKVLIISQVGEKR
jgi:hypothetical protein